MAAGKQRKERNARAHFLKTHLQKRLINLKSYDTSTVEELNVAIDMLEEDIVYSPTVTIPHSEHLPSGTRYKNSTPHGYVKKIKELKSRLLQTLQNEVESRKDLHQIPLFEKTQIIEWGYDGETNQINRLVTAMNRLGNQKRSPCFNSLSDVIDNIVEIWKIAGLQFPPEVSVENSWSLLTKAIERYERINDIHLHNDYSSDDRHIFDYFAQSLTGEEVKIISEKSTAIIKTTEGDLEKITDSFDVLSNARNIQNTRKAAVKKVLLATQEKDPVILVNRLFVGSGWAGMTLMSTDPTVAQSSRKAYEQLKKHESDCDFISDEPIVVETLLISDQETGHWTSAQHRAEQEHPLLEIPGNANANDFVPKQKGIERHIRTNTRHLFYANTINMALKDTPPPLFGVLVKKLQKKENHHDWSPEADFYNYRLNVSIIDEHGMEKDTYIYAQEIDFALGMGVGQMTSFEDALQYESSRKNVGFPGDLNEGKTLLSQQSAFDSNKGFTPIIHGNDYDLSDREKQNISDKKDRRVVVIGGAGGAATAFRMAVLGSDERGYRLQNPDKTFLESGEGIELNPNVKLFARGRVNYNILAAQAIEAFEYAKSKSDLHEGYLLVGIEIEENELILRFHNRMGAVEITDNATLGLLQKAKKLKSEDQSEEVNQSLRDISQVISFEWVEDGNKYYLLNLHVEKCDQLIAGMGQDASKIRALIFQDKEFTAQELEIKRGFDGHYSFVAADNNKIRFHGAMGGNLTAQFAEDIATSVRNSNLPRNSNDPNIMPNVMGKMFSFFATKESVSQRRALNVNTCYLKRNDVRNRPTEFKLFLEKAGLTHREITSFEQFLLKQRKEDPTGAGVSHENLVQYIKNSSLYDKIQVVSSCTIIAIQENANLAKLTRRV